MAKHGSSQSVASVKTPKLGYLLRAIFVALALLCSTTAAPVANALPIIPSSLLNLYAQSDIMFVGGDDCTTADSNGIFMGAQYSFTDDQLKRLWWAALSEQPESGVKNELSLFANLYESYNGSVPGDNNGLIALVRDGVPVKWFDSAAGQAYDTGGVTWGGQYQAFPDPTADQIAAARDILNNGRRTIPPQILEHTATNSLTRVSNRGKEIDRQQKSAYISGVTVIENKMGSTYVFYVWANGEKTCPDGSYESCGDAFGYFANNPPTESYSVGNTAKNAKYDGSRILSDAELQQIQQNKSTYEQAATQYDLPWQLLAAIHYREHNLAVDNPANGDGAYQITGQSFLPAGAISAEEFARQSEIAAAFIRQKIGSLDLSRPENVQRALFLYNGAATAYIEKALSMGFTKEQAANGAGSPYVMNMYDAARDPNSASMSHLWPGRYVGDRHYDATSTDRRPGAFLVYQALGGSSQSDSFCAIESSWGAQIAAAAMNLAWEVSEKGSTNKNKPKDKYIEAMRTVGIYERYNGAPPGASCDQFVATVMRSTGADPNFNLRIANESGTYMQNHPELYTEIAYNGSNPEDLQSGDIFSTVGSGQGGHIWIYLKLGDQYGRADASWDDRTAEYYTTSIPPTSKKGMRYHVFRRNG